MKTTKKSIYGLSVRPCFADLDVDTVVSVLSDSCIEFLELSADEIDFFGNWRTRPRETAGILEDAGLKVWSVHGPRTGWDLGNAEDALRTKAVEISANSFAAATAVGANVVVLHCNIRRPDYPESGFFEHMARTRRSLETLAARAHDQGIRIAVENMNGLPGRRPGSDVQDIRTLIEDLGDHVGICFDTGHSNGAHMPVADQIRLAGDKLFTLHLNDTGGVFGSDDHFIPGEGTIEWSSVLQALDDVQFQSPRILEVKNRIGPTAAMDMFRRVIGLVHQWDSDLDGDLVQGTHV